ncbi:Licheninase [Alteripontixanthobacter maritimus]|uniref:Licheninase n=1 Tax=Alteripontixanthobacter maritimus TaxID=2161824 RepID=A0A369Q8N4_9SPHN|nr:glycoside hydrolase family 16 protein [Alteripontixanthobacter maritimus]RDC60842.1 Licheninase [Alteripontixanthobacter maritimus]
MRFAKTIFATVTLAAMTTGCGVGRGGNGGETAISAAPQPELPAAIAMPPQDGWTLVWSDEFDGTAINAAKWSFDVDCWGGGNDERQCYTDDARNAFVADGILNIVARKGDTTGPAFPPYLQDTAAKKIATRTQPYSSARMVTKGKAAWKYGRIDVRAKLPQGQGTWPAIWMLPEDNVYGSWAMSGEIDIMEAVNWGVPCAKCPGGKENTVLGTLHFGGAWPDNLLDSTEAPLAGSIDEFHTYTVIWREGHFLWAVDGVSFASKTAADWSTTATDAPNAPFDQDFHLILNLAIGGGLPEERGLKGVSPEGFPKRFAIDYVRVWQCAADPATGAACARDEGN